MANPQFGPVASTETYVSDALIAGSYPIATDSVTIASSAALTRGTVLGQITASGKFIKSASAASDGSQTIIAILAQDTDASGGDVAGAPVYLTGEFNAASVTLGAGWTAATAKVSARPYGIFLKGNVLPSDPV